ncbi:MAG TPA: anti-sigma-F factor Fin family protein [Sporosarcina psychrophila]|uniref:Anti-sigma-F factor Fin family protein n=1 Tax=Sporosarcina psychrophila TaxID=1476 RepID=A0A921G0Q6_SPOPS|nr:anti-sigma-F factor Fin family protein [Sporosarcina psychrophila]
MAIRYTCRHCETEIGILPFESVKETVLLLQQIDEGEAEQFLTYEKDGALTVRCICEQCEQSLQRFPDYYTLNKWLQ